MFITLQPLQLHCLLHLTSNHTPVRISNSPTLKTPSLVDWALLAPHFTSVPLRSCPLLSALLVSHCVMLILSFLPTALLNLEERMLSLSPSLYYFRISRESLFFIISHLLMAYSSRHSFFSLILRTLYFP